MLSLMSAAGFAATPKRLPTRVGTAPIHPGRLSLSQDEIAAALKGRHADLIAEIYDVVRRQAEQHFARQARLDAKANSLIAAVGLVLTVLFSFGGQVLLGSAVVPKLGPVWASMAVGVMAAATGCALKAAWNALGALRVRAGLGAIGDEAIFSASHLDRVEAVEEKDPGRGIARYRSALIVAMWPALQQQYAAHEEKAALIKSGQLRAFSGATIRTARDS